MHIRAALSFLLFVSISCQSFEYYGANMTSPSSSQYPQTILYSKFHPTIACTVYNSSYFGIYQYVGTGYIMSTTIKANGTTTSCTVSYDSNTIFLLINSTVIKVFTRTSNGGSFSMFTTLTGVQTTSKQLQSNSNGSLLGTINGNTMHVWIKNGSIYSPYISTIVGSGLIDFRFRSDDQIVIATITNIQIPLRDFNGNYTTVTFSSNMNTTKMDMSLDGSVIVIADKNSKTQIFVTDSSRSSCTPVRTLQNNNSNVLMMLKVAFDGSAFATVDNVFTRRQYFSTQKNNSADTNPNEALVANCIWFYSQCLFNCSADAYSQSSENHISCLCKDNYQWSTSRCQRKCSSDIFSTGNVNSDPSVCGCVSGYSFNSTGGKCEINSAKATSSSNAVGLGVGIGIAAVSVVGLSVLGVWFYRRRKQQEAIAAGMGPYVVPSAGVIAPSRMIPPSRVLGPLSPLHNPANITGFALPAGAPHRSQLAVCSVCLEANPDVVTNCRHPFHRECIQQWMRRDPRCPNCRRTPVSYI